MYTVEFCLENGDRCTARQVGATRKQVCVTAALSRKRILLLGVFLCSVTCSERARLLDLLNNMPIR